MGKKILALLLVLSIESPAVFQVCPAKEGVVSFNVGFDYHNSRKAQLPGVNKDVLVMKELAKVVGNKSYLIRDKDVSDKANFLESLKRQSSTSTTIFFNYSGHGILTKSGEFAIILPSAPSECVISNDRTKPVDGFYRMAATTMAKEEIPAPKSEVQDSPAKKILQGHGAKTLAKSILPEIKELKYLHSVYNDTSENCRRFYVTASEISEVFKGKTVYGIIDSCFSGALRMNPGMNFIYSSTDTQLSKDADYGGVLFSAVKKMMHEHACSIDFEQKRYLTYADIMDRLPAVYFEKGSQVEAMGIDEAEDQLKKALTNYRYAKKGTELKAFNGVKDLQQGQTVGANREVEKNLESVCHDMITYNPEDCVSPLNSTFKIQDPISVQCGGRDLQLFNGDRVHVFIQNPETGKSLVKVGSCPDSLWLENRVLKETQEPYLHKIRLPETARGAH